MAKTNHIIQPIGVTYSQLVTLINNSGLTEGQQYRITDFQTVHYIIYGGGDINSGSTEILITTAISENEISPVVKSELYPQDLIHYDWNPSNWLTDIGFSSGGVIIPNFKGVITLRHDTKNDNKLWYDFRNVKFRRWETNIVPVGQTTKFVAYDSSYQDPGYDMYIIENMGTVNVPNIESYEDYLTFNCTNGQTYENTVIHNIFSKRTVDTILSNNVFHIDNSGSIISDNMFDKDCIDNTFSYKVTSNKIGAFFEYNLIGYDFNSNVVGDFFHKNYVRNSVSSNTIRSNNINNIFFMVDGCSFGYEIQGCGLFKCYYTYFSGNIYDSVFGDHLSSFGWDIDNSTIGGNWYDNIIKYCDYSTLGSDWSENVITKIEYSMIGSELFLNIIPTIEYSTIGNQINELTITDHINASTIGSELYTNTFNTIQYSTIGNQWSDNIFNDFYGNTAGSVFYNNNCQSMYYNELGNGFNANILGNAFNFNTVKNDIARLIIPENFRGNTINNRFSGIPTSIVTISSSIPGITDDTINVEFYLGTTNTKRAKLTNATDDIVIYDAETGTLLKTFSGV